MRFPYASSNPKIVSLVQCAIKQTSLPATVMSKDTQTRELLSPKANKRLMYWSKSGQGGFIEWGFLSALACPILG